MTTDLQPTEKAAIVFTGLDLLTIPETPPQIPAESVARRDKLQARLALFTRIDTQAQHDLAMATEKEADEECRKTEASRVVVTKPMLWWQRLAMSFKDQLCEPLERETARTRVLRKAFNERIERERAEAARKAKAEADRLTKEAADKLAAEQKAIRDEQARKQKEIDDAALAAAKVATTADDARKARMAALRASMEAEEQAEAAEARVKVAAANRATEHAVIANTSPVPSALRDKWKWKVTDAAKLAQANPELVTIIPKAREIDAQIRAGVRKIDGLEIWEERELKR